MGKTATVPKAEMPNFDEAVGVPEKPKPVLDLTNIQPRRTELFRDWVEGIIEQAQEGLSEETNGQIGVYLKGTPEKRDDLVDFLQAIDDEAERLKKVEAGIAGRRKDLEKISRNMRDSITVQMDNFMLKRVDGAIHRISLRDGMNSVVVDDINSLPAEFINWTPSPDKSALSKALHEGKEIPGCHLETGRKFIVLR